MRKFVSLPLIILLLSCGRDNTRQTTSHGLQITASKGIWQNPDSFEKPVIIPVNHPPSLPAGKPHVASNDHDKNVFRRPKVVTTGTPCVFTPGHDTLAMPEIFPAVGQVNPAGYPEIIMAKDMVSKNQNPANFRFFKTLQGLKHNGIRCLLEDRTGNIWLGTNGGGAARYDGKSFTHFTEKQGLAHDAVNSMKQDKNGNIWFGTREGISCYDGKTFTNYINKRGAASNRVLSILEDKEGHLWFGTEGGVSRFDGKNFTWFTTQQGLAGNAVSCMLQTNNGDLWFGTHSGVSRYDGNSFANFTSAQGLADNYVTCMLLDTAGHIWFGTNHGVSRYDGHSFSNYTQEQGLADNMISSVLQAHDGLFWFGAQGGGLSRFNGNSFRTFSEPDGFTSAMVLCMLQDKFGNLWIGTDGDGVSLYGENSFTNFTDKEGLTNDAVWSILQDKSGKLWFGNNGRGTSRFDGNSFSNFSTKQGLVDNVVVSQLQDRQGNFWFGTYGGGVSRFDRKSFTNFTQQNGLAGNFISVMLQDKAGAMWFGTHGGGVSRYDGKSFTNFSDKQGLGNNFIHSMLQDAQGNLWFGTYGGGVSRYDGKSFTRFTEKDGLAGSSVIGMLQDNNGILWFGTYNGLSRYDGQRFVNFTDKQGLISNAVLNILQDKEGNIWFGTRKGLSKIASTRLSQLSAYLARLDNQTQSLSQSTANANFDPIKQALFYNYGYNDGFVGLNCRRNAVFQDTQGRIWWGADVLTYFVPGADRADTTAPVVQLNSIKLFGEEIAWARLGAVTTDKNGHETVSGTSRDTLLGNGVLLHNIHFDGIANWYPLPQHLSLPYNNNNLTFDFIGVHIQSRNHMKYQYTLQGLEDNWSVVTERDEAHYGNLPPGNYTFKVKAMNQSGVWSLPFEFSFEVRPPWWQTWWFRATVLASVLAGIWAYIKWRERELKERQRELELRINEATLELKESHRAIKEQKQVIEERHKEITDSINYAERIQRSFLATREHLDRHLSEYFIFFRPKDVVSGDFYWSATLNNGNFAMVCADSTGHGVPGAIMSLLNVTSLERAIEMETEPHKILNTTRKIIIERLTKDGSAEGGKDGMDGSLLSFDFKNNLLYCAAANNPVCIIRNNQLIEIKSDRIPIGKHERDQEPFTLHTLQLQKGDLVYSFTDGFSDQFGGLAGKKFKYKKLLELLLSLANEPMAVQKQKLTEIFNDWKGSFEQVDDVTVIGVRV